jgi:citrate lyase subunit beta/citryl-CoA lyase
VRSFLFVPADSERKLARAMESAADALVLDLEDAVLPDRKSPARQLLAGLAQWTDPHHRLWVRVNEPGSAELLADLVAVAPLRPRGVVLPKIRGPEDVQSLSDYLTMAEAVHGIAAGSIKIIAVCTETPMAVLRVTDLARARLPRLAGLMWGGEDLSSALGADDPRAADGSWRGVYQHARTQCLLAARALDVLAIDTVYVDVKDLEGCRHSAREARADGFDAKIAIHPEQVLLINEAFSPSEAEIDRAHRIVAAFAAGSGALVFEGKMLDMPHLKAAKRLLSAAGVLSR